MSTYTTAKQLKAQLQQMIYQLDNVPEDYPIAVLNVDEGGYSDPVLTEKIVLSLEDDQVDDFEGEEDSFIRAFRLDVRYKPND